MFLPTSLISGLELDARQWTSILKSPPTQLPLKPMKTTTGAVTTNSGDHLVTGLGIIQASVNLKIQPFEVLNAFVPVTWTHVLWAPVNGKWGALLLWGCIKEEGGRCLWWMCERDWELKCSSGMFYMCYVEKILHKEKSNCYIYKKTPFLHSSLLVSLLLSSKNTAVWWIIWSAIKKYLGVASDSYAARGEQLQAVVIQILEEMHTIASQNVLNHNMNKTAWGGLLVFSGSPCQGKFCLLSRFASWSLHIFPHFIMCQAKIVHYKVIR